MSAVAALALSVLVGPVPARAATPRHDLWIFGNTTGYVDVVFPSRFRPHVGAYDDPVRPEGWSDGRFTGVWIESLSRRGTGPGGVATTPAGGNYHVQFGEPDGGAWLPAGAYRVHLMTDKVSYFRIPVDGLSKTRYYVPLHPETLHTNVVTSAADLPGGRLGDVVRTGAHTLAVAVGLVRAESSVVHVDLCVAASTQLPCEADPAARSDNGSVDLAAPGKRAEVVYIVAMPKTLPDGEHDVGFRAAAVPDSTRLELFTLTLG